MLFAQFDGSISKVGGIQNVFIYVAFYSCALVKMSHFVE